MGGVGRQKEQQEPRLRGETDVVEELLWLLFLSSPVRGRVGGCGSRQEGEAPHPKLEKQWPGALVQVPAFASPAPPCPRVGSHFPA